MRGRLLRLLGAAAIVVMAAGAAAQSRNCARNLTLDNLRLADAEALALANDFRDAFAGMNLDTATSTVSTVGATLMGNALAREVSATIDGLRHLVYLRDEAPLEMREIIVDRLAVAMGAAGKRMHKVANSYGQVSLMSNLDNVRALAEDSEQFAGTFAKRWSCE